MIIIFQSVLAHHVIVSLITGSTLKEYITRLPFSGLDAHTALILVQHLLRILLYLQSKNVIHNDIKGTDLCRGR